MARKRTMPGKPAPQGSDTNVGHQDFSLSKSGQAETPPAAAHVEEQEDHLDDEPTSSQDAEARARAREAQRRDAELAMSEYQQQRETIQKRTARLRAQRLAREAAKPQKAKPE